jgi:hypothetical protein
MFEAGSAIGKLGLDVSEYTRGILAAQGISALFPQVVTQFLANPLLGVIGIMKEVASSIKGMFLDAQEEADRINDLSTAVGVSAEALSAWGLAASQAGSGTQEIADGFKFLAKNMADAAAGNKTAVAAFGQLGISQEMVRSGMKDLDGMMFRVADGLAGMEAGAMRSDVALSILGRSGLGLIPTLQQGSRELTDQMNRFAQYGAVVSTSQARAADAFGDTWGEIKIAWAGIKQMLAEPIRDALMPVLQGWLNWIQNNPEQIRAMVRSIGQTVVGVIQWVIGAVKELIAHLELLSTIALVTKTTIAGMQAGSMLGGPIGAVLGGAIGFSGGMVGSAVMSNSIRSTIQNNTININNEGTWPELMSPAQIKRSVGEALKPSLAEAEAMNVREGL